MTIRYVTGDATNPLAAGPKIIAHVCNDIGKWGKGFVMAVSSKWPSVRVAYLDWYQSSAFGLGKVLYVRVRPDIMIANMVGQTGIRTGSKGPPIRYDALGTCLDDIAKRAIVEGASIRMPKIGTGLAGGSWEIIRPLLNKHLKGIDVTVYELGGGS
jgi:O-acetyl-ADP-ribose deacetylase (regulator of RNase III)